MKNLRFLLLTIAMMTILFFRSVSADTIYQSSTYNAASTGGPTLDSNQSCLGSRFYIDHPVQVTSVGTHLWSYTLTGSYFAALVTLDGSSDFPNGNPIDSGEVIASTVFKYPKLQANCNVPLSAYLEPGYYAIVFGTDSLGAQGGSGWMPSNKQTILPGNLGNIYFDGPNDQWHLNSGADYFVVEGNIVPEPATLSLLALGGLALLRKRRA